MYMHMHMNGAVLREHIRVLRTGEYCGPGWEHRAACRYEDPELFFPLAETGPAYVAQIREAKGVCMRCPVFLDCRREALRRSEGAGVFGGMTTEERRAVLRYAQRHDIDRASFIGAA